MDSERARLAALLEKCEAMLAELASRDDPALLSATADLQATALDLRAKLKVLDARQPLEGRRSASGDG